MSELEAALRRRLGRGGRAFVPYAIGGHPSVTPAFLRGFEQAGADAVEVGVPFSDPVMDGPVIQEASRVALEAGATLDSVLDLVEEAGLGVPVAVMTYLNPVLAMGTTEFLRRAPASGVSAVIVPDLPVDEADDWCAEAAEHHVETVFLAAPGTSSARLGRVARGARGFVYCVSTYGVTGERDELGGTARELVESLRPMTDRPLLVGVGLGTPGQAAEACRFADGVVVGTALVRPLLDADVDGALALAAEFRGAVPAAKGS
ncbi:MAG TPA: tryptophan synthase subunit alpha [Actinomycetota bacterium]